MTPGPVIEHGPHWWKRAPSLLRHPCFPLITRWRLFHATTILNSKRLRMNELTLILSRFLAGRENQRMLSLLVINLTLSRESSYIPCVLLPMLLHLNFSHFHHVK